MMSIASDWMRDSVRPEIEAMMLNDAHFRLVLSARRLTGKFNGPTAKLLQDGYLTYQMQFAKLPSNLIETFCTGDFLTKSCQCQQTTLGKI
jgi:hypothetical protein